MTTQLDGTGWTSVFTQAGAAWVEAYATVSANSQAIANRWIKTCTDQFQRNLDLWTKLTGCQDIAEASATQQRWWQGTVDQLGTEFKEAQDQMATLSQPAFAPLRKIKPERSRRTHAAAAE
jgi:hypothetical protein